MGDGSNTDRRERRIVPARRGRGPGRLVALATGLVILGALTAGIADVQADTPRQPSAGTIIVPPPTPTPTPLPLPPSPSPSPTPSSTDVTPPETTIDSASGKNRDASITVTFSSSEPGATFECSVDGQTSPCESPFVLEGLGRGPHTFSVTAIDAAGNRDPSPSGAELRRRPGRRWTWRCFGGGGPCVVIRRRAV
jgi:hypothetical protein